MTIAVYAVFVFFGPIMNVLAPKIGDISLLWILFYLLVVTFLTRQGLTGRFPTANLWLFILAFFYLFSIASVSWSDHYSYDMETSKRLFARYLVPLIMAFIALNLIRREKEVRIVSRAVLVAAVLLSLTSIFQMIFGYQMLFQPEGASETFRASGTFQNPNGLAVFLVLCVPHILYGRDAGTIPRWIGSLSLLCLGAGIICTVSRKGIATGAVAVLLYFLLRKERGKAFLVLLLVGLGAIAVSSHQLISQRFTTARLATQFEGKANMMLAGMKMFMQSPVIGLGYQGYYENFGRYFPRSPQKKYDAHNMYVTVLANSGIIGFFLFLWVFLYPLGVAFRTIWGRSPPYRREMAIVCAISIIAFMANGFYAGGLLDFWPIVLLFYTNVAMLFSYPLSANGKP